MHEDLCATGRYQRHGQILSLWYNYLSLTLILASDTQVLMKCRLYTNIVGHCSIYVYIVPHAYQLKKFVIFHLTSGLNDLLILRGWIIIILYKSYQETGLKVCWKSKPFQTNCLQFMSSIFQLLQSIMSCSANALHTGSGPINLISARAVLNPIHKVTCHLRSHLPGSLARKL